MAQLVIQMPSNERLSLLEELVAQLGGTVEKVVSRVKAKEKPFVELSASALSKDWNSPEDADWDSVLAQMPAI